MLHTVETRDHYAAGHKRRVLALARFVAREMGLSQATTNTIHLAGPIHRHWQNDAFEKAPRLPLHVNPGREGRT